MRGRKSKEKVIYSVVVEGNGAGGVCMYTGSAGDVCRSGVKVCAGI